MVAEGDISCNRQKTKIMKFENIKEEEVRERIFLGGRYHFLFKNPLALIYST